MWTVRLIHLVFFLRAMGQRATVMDLHRRTSLSQKKGEEKLPPTRIACHVVVHR